VADVDERREWRLYVFGVGGRQRLGKSLFAGILLRLAGADIVSSAANSVVGDYAVDGDCRKLQRTSAEEITDSAIYRNVQ
jgi:hypothetical protein